MKLLQEQEKRDLLNEVLIELSKYQDILKTPKLRDNFFVRLESIYYNCNHDNFRHYYSDIFSTLTLIDGDPTIGSLDILAQNMQTIKDGYTPRNLDEENKIIDISKEIVKLYDHTNLDIARINYTKTMTNDTLSELSKNRLLLNELDDKVKSYENKQHILKDEIIDKANTMSDEMKENQKSMQKEYTTILGIFASVVLAFTGGMVFSTSVLENINKPSIYRISLVSFAIGIVFFNLIWVLLDFIKQIIGHKVKNTWLWFGINAILISGIICACLSYKHDWFSKDITRNMEKIEIDVNDK